MPNPTRLLLEAWRIHYRPAETRASQIKAAIYRARASLRFQMLEIECQHRTRQAQGSERDQ